MLDTSMAGSFGRYYMLLCAIKTPQSNEFYCTYRCLSPFFDGLTVFRTASADADIADARPHDGAKSV